MKNTLTAGDLICDHAPDERHCLHEKTTRAEQVCCWCGNLFISEGDLKAEHGPYEPKWALSLRNPKKIKI